MVIEGCPRPDLRPDLPESARRIDGIQDMAYGLTSMVGCRRWNGDESIHVNGVEVSIMGHDRPRW
jgi:hypothetical protein